MSPLQLYGVVAVDGHLDAASLGQGLGLVTFRDLGAVVSEAATARPAESPEAMDAQRRALEAVFVRTQVLPAPPGVVFRTPDVLTRWLELHYVTLNDALGFVEGRVGARVHVTRVTDESPTSDPPTAETMEAVGDVAAIATGSFRVLRRHAVTSVPLKGSGEVGMTTSAAFLVERERWQLFVDMVHEEDKRVADVTYEVTGPWPPYDFVRMQFGG